MGMTALLPLVAFPLAGVSSAEKAAAPYANSAVFLFMGGFLVAATFERWGLHRRTGLFRAEPRRHRAAAHRVRGHPRDGIPVDVDLEHRHDPDDDAHRRGHRRRSRRERARRRPRSSASRTRRRSEGSARRSELPTNLIFLGAARELFPTRRSTITFARVDAVRRRLSVVLVPACWLSSCVTHACQRARPSRSSSSASRRPGAMSRGEKTTLALCVDDRAAVDLPRRHRLGATDVYRAGPISFRRRR